MLTRAIVRRPGPDFAAGLTSGALGAPDHARMLAQHADYVAALRNLGLHVDMLDDAPGFPDAYFVEDVAVIVPELAVVARPGAASRRGEDDLIVPVLARHKPVARIVGPATLDGGDVLIVGQTVFVGLSQRTNAAGAEQLSALLAPLGYGIRTVPVPSGLHLKSGVTSLGGDLLLIADGLAGAPQLRGHSAVVVDADEERACNALLVNGTVLFAAGFPKTRRKLAAMNLRLLELDAGEAAKMDGGLTCMSLRW
jgi:dimethylargininase